MRTPWITRCRSLMLLLTTLPLLLGGACSAQATDAFVVISGGGNPASNHYSQYLQARAYVTYLRAHYPHKSIWTFFGAGNQSGQPPVLFDVEQTGKDEKGHAITTWIAGALPDNRPARHDEIARAFRDEILPAVKQGGTLYLFVGDHGGPSADSPGESIISLWGWNRDPTIPYGWRDYRYSETLGVAELRRWLSAGLGRGRVVFVMSQCFSGGFHYLGLPREEAADPAWFAKPPAWARPASNPSRLPSAAGFTATDDQSFASGCTSDVSADRWAGYERYMPENLTGLDVFTLKPGKLPMRASFYDAHVQAVQVDQTIDKPRSTSEQYLADWAQAIEHMERAPDVAAMVKPALAHFRQAMDGVAPQIADAALQARAGEFRHYAERMMQANPNLKDLLHAPQSELESAIRPQPMRSSSSRARRYPDDDANAEMNDQLLISSLWGKTIEPAWQHALRTGELSKLPAPVQAYERDLANFREAATAAQSMGDESSANPASAIDPDLFAYYESGYADPATFDSARAKVIAGWDDRRYQAILAWAKKSADEKVKAAAIVVLGLMPDSSSDSNEDETAPTQADKQPLPKPLGPSHDIAAARLLLYRRVLASWQFLLEMKDKPALEQLAALIELERTPLPVPTR